MIKKNIDNKDKPQILIVDDDHLCLEAVTKLLVDNYTCEVDAVDSAEKALDRIYGMALQWRPRWYDLVLMDINMPILNGDLLTKILKESEASMKKIPVIAITSAETASNQAMFFERGIVEIIIKPVTIEKLATIISKYLSN